MNASIDTERQHSQMHANPHAHPHSINIQGELSLEWVCVSAASTSKRQRARERMAGKMQEREKMKVTMRDGREKTKQKSKQWKL